MSNRPMTPERSRIAALWSEYLDRADNADDEGTHVGFARYYRSVGFGLELALNILDDQELPPDLDPGGWPHSHATDPALDNGTPHSPGDSHGAENLFVRCHDCLGRGCDSCGGTGFDWLDTEQARATVRMVAE
jgi:hypothetical protein